MIKTAVTGIKNSYPEFPFNPGIRYPEYPYPDFIPGTINEVYDAVRNNFVLLGYDNENYGTAIWNPLKDFVKPGTTVFIKPNFVDNKHRHGGNIWSVITHPSVIRAVADFVVIALKGKGKILIGDNSHVDTDFEDLSRICRLNEIKNFIESNSTIKCEITDCRFWHMPDLKYYGFKDGREALPGDPEGEIMVDIGSQSMFKGTSAFLFRGTYNERTETIKNHVFGKHRYYFSRSIFTADTYISIPKLKTHAKVGVTLNIKGLIGTISNKNCLVHWRIGFPKFGGDEFPNPQKNSDYFKLYWQHFLFSIIPSRIYFKLRNFFNSNKIGKLYNDFINIEYQKQKMLRGAFSTNDTTWRMTVDVYNSFIKDITGFRKKNNLKTKFFSVVDGVIGGELDGPHYPEEKIANVVISGEDLLAVDLVSARLMGMDISKISYLKHLFEMEYREFSELKVLIDKGEYPGFFEKKDRYLGFRPPSKWPELRL